MTEKLHILIANVFFAPYSYGGATIVAEEVAKELTANFDVRVSAVSLIRRRDLQPYHMMKVEKDGIINYLVNVPEHRSYAELYDNPGVTEAFATLVDILKPDLLHLHCIQEMGIGLLSVARLRELPTILSVHDFWWLCERQFMIRPSRQYCGQDPIRIENCKGCVSDHSRARLRFQRLLAEASGVDLITFPSRFAKDLCERSGLNAKRTEVWTNGVRLPGPGFAKAQAARRQKDGRIVFGFVGGPSQIKGWPLVRDAFGAVERKDFKGILVDGSLDGSWWRGHDVSGLKGEWSVYPRYAQADLDKFYAQIDVLLFLSQWKETFGLTIRECLARGIRVIQTDSGGTTEWDGADTSDMLAIGDGPKDLLPKIEKILTETDDLTAPITVSGFPQQAKELMTFVTEILQR